MTAPTNMDTRREALAWYIDHIRLRIMDYEELNELIGKRETGNQEILACIEATIADWNAVPPPLSDVDIWDFPDREALTLGTMAKLALGGTFLQFRNQLSFSAGGISVNTHDKGGPYKMLHDTLYAMFRERVIEKKSSMNVQNMLRRRGGLGSDYGLLHWFGNNLSSYL